MTAQPAPYPSHWEADVVLRDGSVMRIRPIRPDDADALQRFHLRQSAESTYLRFFAPMARLSDRMLAQFTQIDYRDQVALVLVDGPEIIAVGRFERVDADSAEVAFNVADSAQGKGLGSVLLEHLAAAGRELGVRRFTADVLPQNSRMVRVFADAGYDVTSAMEDGIVEVSFGITSTDRSRAVISEREQRAEASSMAALMRPAAAVLVHAGTEGRQIAAVLGPALRASDGFPVTVLDADADADLSSRLAQIAPVDLALVAAPAMHVVPLLPHLAAAGVRAVVLYTGDFAVDGTQGGNTQRGLVRQIREHGLRLVGPRSYGLIAQLGPDAAGRLQASLYPRPPASGGVGVFCQSAASGRALLDGARVRNLGLSSFLSAGHRVDVSGNDAMQYWVGDDATTVACLRLESIGNPRKFTRVARRLAGKIPVIASIAGTTGQLRPPGHEVAISTEPRRVLDEIMHQCGVLVTDSVADALDLAMTFAHQPLPAGRRVLIVTNSGAHLAVAGELLRAAGLEPIDDTFALSPTSGAAAYAEVVDQALQRDDWDIALVAYVPLLHDDGGRVGREAARLAGRSGRMTLAVIDGIHGLDDHLRCDSVAVPGFTTLSGAASAAGHTADYAARGEDDNGTGVSPPGIDRSAAKSLVQSELAGLPPETTRRLSATQAASLLGHYGISLWPHIRVTSLEEALQAAEQVGWPVVLKTSEEILRHRLDLGGVRLDLSTPAELTAAYHGVQQRVQRLIGRQAAPLEVQAMAPAGVATVIRAREDRLYGPIVSFGLSGDASELLGDVSFRVPPLTEVDVRFMVSSLQTSKRLLGDGALPALHVAGVEDVLARVSVLKEELAEVTSVTLHPMVVTEHEIAILGARIDLAHPARGDAARRVLPA